MFCEGCGTRLATDSAFCSTCGRPRSGSAGWASSGTATQVLPTRPVVTADGFPVPHSAGNGFSTAGIILGALAFLFFPIILGPAGLILGAVAKSKGEKNAVVAMAVAACGTVIGMILGALVFASLVA